MRLYQFMKAEHGLSALQNSRLKVSRIHELNDPFEFLGVELSDVAFRRALQKTKRQISRSRGLLCFSRRWENPVLWAHYAKNHTGICLGFDMSRQFMEKVTYVKERFTRPNVLDEDFMKALLFSKFEHWSYEEEYRCYVTLDDPIDNLYYKGFDKDLALREVVVGFRSKVAREEIAAALDGLVGKIDVIKARPAFKSFEMAKQKNASLWA